jgi:hypothetical protein
MSFAAAVEVVTANGAGPTLTFSSAGRLDVIANTKNVGCLDFAADA